MVSVKYTVPVIMSLILASAFLSGLLRDQRSAAAAEPVQPGYDLFTTPFAELNFGDPFGLSIPPDFFGQGSLPPLGPFPLRGVPIGGEVGETDTIIVRTGDTSPIAIQIVELNLESVAPLVVRFDDGSTQLWDVDINLFSTPSNGALDVVETSPDGGFFAIELNLFPEITFTQVGSSITVVIDPDFVPSEFPFQFGSSGLYATSCPGALQVNNPVSGIVTTPDFCLGTDPATGTTFPVELFDIGGSFATSLVRTQSAGSSLTIVKDADPNDATDFQFTGDFGEFMLDDDDDPALENTVTFSELSPGTYTFFETQQPGWNLTDVFCTGLAGQFLADTSTGVVMVEVGASEEVTCTLTNTRPGSITIVKNAIGPETGETFLFDAGTLGTHAITDTGDELSTGSHTILDVLAGIYSIEELDAPDWLLTDISCVDPTLNSNGDLNSRAALISLESGEHVTCTFVNQQAGTVMIVKSADPMSPQDFSFEGSFGPFLLDDDVDPTLPNARIFMDLAPGTYTVGELPTDGWFLTNLECSDPSDNSSVNLGLGEATIVVDSGELVTCTFHNLTTAGTVTIVKDAQPNGPDDFRFGGDFGTFFLDDDATDATLSNSITFSNVVPGRYLVQEFEPDEWVTTGITCDDPSGNSQGAVTLSTAVINVDSFEHITCTFTNERPGTIRVVKDAVSWNPGETFFEFSLLEAARGTTTMFPLSDDHGPDSSSFAISGLRPGSYVLAEQAKDGWVVTHVSCADETGGTSTGTEPPQASIHLAPGDVVECRFRNEELGSIKIVKEAEPGGTAQDFSFVSDLGAVTLDDNDDPGLPDFHTFEEVVPGLHTISEVLAPGWELTGINCQDPSGDSETDVVLRTATVRVGAGEPITCTFTNTQLGTISIVKDAVPDGPQDFEFTGDFGPFSLDDDSDFTLENFNTVTGLLPGIYRVSELPVPGWLVPQINCEDPTGDSTNGIVGFLAEIELGAGEHVTCTFVNRRTGTVTIIKDSVPDSPQDFEFESLLGPALLDDDDDPTLQNSVTFTNIVPGSYTIAEFLVSGWRVTSIDCSDPTGNSTVDQADATATVVVDPGDDITCTFENRPAGASVTIVKDASPDDPQDFSFQGELGFFTLDDDDDPTLQNSKTFTDVTPRSYLVGELATNGWEVAQITCEDPTNDSSGILTTRLATINVSPGEHVTCTFVNTRLASLTVIKDTVPDDSQDFSFTGELGDFVLDDDDDPALKNSITFTNLSPGQYDFTEVQIDGWATTDFTCSGASGGFFGQLTVGALSVTLGEGDEAICTVSNARTGTVTIVKNAIGADGVFDFQGGFLGSFSISDSGDPNSEIGHVIQDVPVGEWRVLELVPAGWILTDISCLDPTGDSTGDVEKSTAFIAMGPGEEIRCTFTNQKAGTVTIRLDADPESPQDFEFKGSLGEGLLDDDDDPTLSNTGTFRNVAPGAYTLTMSAVPDWRLVGLGCDDPTGNSSGDTGTRTATITVESGEEITCVFAVEQFGAVTIIKDARPDDPQDFTFTGDFGEFKLDDDSDPALPNFQTFINVLPSQYEVTEEAVPDWALPRVECVDPTGDSTSGVATSTAVINVGPGERVTCFFINERQGSEDRDEDGFDSIPFGGDDCDDNNADVHPGATEFIDGLDNNCDGLEDGFLGLDVLRGSFNPRSKGLLPVAVLGSGDIDVLDIDIQSVTFSQADTTPVHGGHIEDVNGDGIFDLVFHFPAKNSIPFGDKGNEFCLDFLVTDVLFSMCDTVRIVPHGTPPGY